MPIAQLFSTVFHRDVEKVVLGFTPKNRAGFHSKTFHQADETLFVLKENPAFVTAHRLQYPFLSHA